MISQPLDSKTLPCMASNPRNPAMSPHTEKSGQPSQCDNNGKKEKGVGGGGGGVDEGREAEKIRKRKR